MARGFDVEHIPPGAKLELYISPDCPYCRRAMAYYDAAGTPYAQHDAQNDLRAARADVRVQQRRSDRALHRRRRTVRSIGVGLAAARLNGPLTRRSARSK